MQILCVTFLSSGFYFGVGEERHGQVLSHFAPPPNPTVKYYEYIYIYRERDNPKNTSQINHHLEHCFNGKILQVQI